MGRCDAFRFISQISRDDVFVCLFVCLFHPCLEWLSSMDWRTCIYNVCCIIYNIYIYQYIKCCTCWCMYKVWEASMQTTNLLKFKETEASEVQYLSWKLYRVMICHDTSQWLRSCVWEHTTCVSNVSKFQTSPTSVDGLLCFMARHVQVTDPESQQGWYFYIFLPCNIVHFSIFRHPRGAASPPASVHKYRRCFAERAAWAAEIHDQAERDRLVTRKLSCAQWRAKLLWGNLAPTGTQFEGDAWFGNKSISESRFFQHSPMQLHHHMSSFVLIRFHWDSSDSAVTHSYS